jgi:hypothetical protein
LRDSTSRFADHILNGIYAGIDRLAGDLRHDWRRRSGCRPDGHLACLALPFWREHGPSRRAANCSARKHLSAKCLRARDQHDRRSRRNIARRPPPINARILAAPSFIQAQII